jgi:hypothetical protein
MNHKLLILAVFFFVPAVAAVMADIAEKAEQPCPNKPQSEWSRSETVDCISFRVEKLQRELCEKDPRVCRDMGRK